MYRPRPTRYLRRSDGSIRSIRSPSDPTFTLLDVIGDEEQRQFWAEVDRRRRRANGMTEEDDEHERQARARLMSRLRRWG